jgi:hypothetical protein
MANHIFRDTAASTMWYGMAPFCLDCVEVGKDGEPWKVVWKTWGQGEARGFELGVVDGVVAGLALDRKCKDC